MICENGYAVSNRKRVWSWEGRKDEKGRGVVKPRSMDSSFSKQKSVKFSIINLRFFFVVL